MVEGVQSRRGLLLFEVFQQLVHVNSIEFELLLQTENLGLAVANFLGQVIHSLFRIVVGIYLPAVVWCVTEDLLFTLA